MVILYDNFCRHAQHAPFNAALIRTVLCGFPAESIQFHAEREHIHAVQQILQGGEQGRMRWSPWELGPVGTASFAERFFDEWRWCRHVMGCALDESLSAIIACSTTRAGLMARKCFVLRGALPCPLLTIHHTELASLMGSRSTRALLKYGPNGLRSVVLGGSIRRNVLRQIPSMEDSLIGIPHPYIFGANRVSSWRASEVPSFGFFGLASKAKGFDKFNRLAEEICSQPEPQAEFRLIGHFSAECPDASEYVVTRVETGKALLGRSRYEDEVSRVHYAVLPYDSEEYGLISSGAILDAFTYAKPCIALRNPLFEEYFAVMGDIGYLCDTFEEMRDLVRSLISSRPIEKYRQQSENILAGRHVFEPESVARELREALDRHSPERHPVMHLRRNA